MRHTLVSRIAEGLSPMGFVEVENHSFELLRHLEPNVYRIEKAHTVIPATRELCQKKACPVEINGWRGGGGPRRRGRLPRTTHHAHRVPAPPWGRGGGGALSVDVRRIVAIGVDGCDAAHGSRFFSKNL